MRPYYNDVADLINELIDMKLKFSKKDEEWRELKHGKATARLFSQIYTSRIKEEIEDLYKIGRDISVHIADELNCINLPEHYRDLTAIVKVFDDDNTWIYSELKMVLGRAVEANKNVRLSIFDDMEGVAQHQIVMTESLKPIIKRLKNSNLYKEENDIPMEKNNYFNNQTVNNISGSNNNTTTSTNQGKKTNSKEEGKDQWYKKPTGLILITVFSGIIVALFVDYFIK